MPYDERHPMFSPDGRWLAYTSNESGRDEVHVRSYPGPGGKQQISNEGGSQVWARDGRELFYRNGNRLMAVAVETEPEFSAGRPTRLFEETFDVGSPSGVDYSSNYDIKADGDRFVMIRPVTQDATGYHLNVVLNLGEELRRRALP
jgi:hypothetical protein